MNHDLASARGSSARESSDRESSVQEPNARDLSTNEPNTQPANTSEPNKHQKLAGGIARVNIDLIFGGLPRLPEEGEELYSESFHLMPGGGVGATLQNIKRLGGDGRFVTFFGQDRFSRIGQQWQEEASLTYLNLYKGDGIPVNISAAMVTPNDRSFVSFTSHPDPIGVPLDQAMEDEAYETLKDCSVVLMQPGYLKLYQRLKQAGVTLVLDMGFDENLSFETYGDYFSITDYYTPNLLEAQTLCGEEDPISCLKQLSHHFQKPLIKLGPEGSLTITDGHIYRIPTIDVGPRVDATGAGDAFLAGLVYGLLTEADWIDACLYGSYLGGVAVTEYGCLTAVPSRTEMLSLTEAAKQKVEQLA